MRIHKIIAVSALLALLVPGFALAGNGHGRGDDNNGRGWGIFGKFHKGERGEHRKNDDAYRGDMRMSRMGTVVSVGSDSFVMKRGNDNSNVTVNVSNDTVIKFSVGGKELALDDIEVNDKVWIKGAKGDDNDDEDNNDDNASINAQTILVTPGDMRPGKIKSATVTEVNGDTLTVETNKAGETATVTVETDDNTTYMNAEGEAIDASEIETGAEVKVKGFWDKTKDFFKAIIIKLK